MSSKFDTAEIKVVLDTKEAERKAEAFGNKLEEQPKKGQRSIKEWADGIKKHISASIPGIAKVGAAFVGAGLALKAAKIAGAEFKSILSGISDFVGSLATQRDTLMNAQWFGVAIEQGTHLQSILDDVKTKFTALQLAVELKQIGFDDEQIANFGHTVNVLAAFTGQAKDAIEKSLKSAQVTDRQLAVLGKTRTGLELAMAQERQRLGGRRLDSNETAQVLVKFLGVTEKTEKALGDLGKANPFDQLKMKAASLWENVKQTGSRAILGIADWFKSVGDSADNMAAKGVKALRALKDAAVDMTSAFAGNVELKQAFEAHRKLLKAQKERLRLQKQMRLEAIQENIARQQQARTTLRNFDRSALAAISGFGVRGVGAVVGGMGQAIEMAKQFTSLLGRGFMRNQRAAELIKLTLEAGRGGLAKLIEGEKQRTNLLRGQMEVSARAKAEILIQNQALNINKSLKQASLLLDQAGAVVARTRSAITGQLLERIRQVKQVMKEQTDEQLRLLQAQRKMAAIKERLAIAQRSVKFAQQYLGVQEAIRRQEENLFKLGGGVVRDLGQRVRLQAHMLRLQNQMLSAQAKSDLAKLGAGTQSAGGAAQLRRQISRSQILITLNTQRMRQLQAEVPLRQAIAKQAADELRLTRAKTVIEQRVAELKARQGIGDLKRQVAGGVDNGATQRRAEELRLSLEVAQKEAEIARNKMATIKDPGALAAQQSEYQHKLAMLALGQQELEQLRRLSAVEAERRTVMGAFVESARQKVQNLSQQIGQNLFSAFQGFTAGIGNMIGNAFTAIVTGSDDLGAVVGKGFLDALAGMAAQLGGFFIAAGTAQMFVPPYTGAGAIAGGLGLVALSGLLKGTSSLIGSSPPKVSAPSSSSASVPSFQQQLPGQQTPRDERPIVVNVSMNQEPWNRQSDAERFKGLAGWVRQQTRATGTILPMGGRP